MMVNQLTSLSVSSAPSNPRPGTQTEIDQTVSLFDQLSMLPSIHDAHVEPDRAESSVSGKPKNKKPRI